MLDRTIFIKQLQEKSHLIHPPEQIEILSRLRAIWNRVANDPQWCTTIAKKIPGLPVHTTEALNNVVPLTTTQDPHTVIGVDGSQIYPDRHEGTDLFLINIGTITCTYGPHSAAHYASIPELYTSTPWDEHLDTIDAINSLRHDRELATLIESTKLPSPLYTLTDGSLLFWHLEAYTEPIRTILLTRYIHYLQQLAEAKTPIAGYISAPKSRDIVTLLRAENPSLQATTDAHLLHTLVPVGYRTPLFTCTSTFAREYPPAVRPVIFYVNTGSEISRIEIPAWLAENGPLRTQFECILYSQILKGAGYPIALSEAHECAVIRGADRDFFYYMLDKISIQMGITRTISSKLRKKQISFI